MDSENTIDLALACLPEHPGLRQRLTVLREHLGYLDQQLSACREEKARLARDVARLQARVDQLTVAARQSSAPAAVPEAAEAPGFVEHGGALFPGECHQLVT